MEESVKYPYSIGVTDNVPSIIEIESELENHSGITSYYYLESFTTANVS